MVDTTGVQVQDIVRHAFRTAEALTLDVLIIMGLRAEYVSDFHMGLAVAVGAFSGR